MTARQSHSQSQSSTRPGTTAGRASRLKEAPVEPIKMRRTLWGRGVPIVTTTRCAPGLMGMPGRTVTVPDHVFYNGVAPNVMEIFEGLAATEKTAALEQRRTAAAARFLEQPQAGVAALPGRVED